MGDNLWIRIALTILAIYRVIYVPAVAKVSTITGSWKIPHYGIFTDFRVFVKGSFLPLLRTEFKLGELLDRKLDLPRLWVNLSTGASTSGISSIVAIYEAVVLMNHLQYDDDEIVNDMESFCRAAYGDLETEHFLRVLAAYNRLYALLVYFFPSRIEDTDVISTPKGRVMRPTYSYEMFSYSEDGSVSRFRRVLGAIWSWFPKTFRPYVVPITRKTHISRLSPKIEPAGKMRLFAIVDYWTQYLLRPLHFWLFRILGGIPQDGTFDQDKAVADFQKVLAQKSDKYVASFDLSAATDRLHYNLIVILLSNLFSLELAQAWTRVITHRGFADTQFVAGGEPVVYATGQPIGAYSSWALLAFVHHALVQFAAHRAGSVGWFSDYAVLGDDIVIADRSVASEYLAVMIALGVEVNLAKSLQSDKGVFEFAKRIATPNEEYSPIPWGAYYQGLRNPKIVPTLVRWLVSHGYTLSPSSLVTAAPTWFRIPRMIYNESTPINTLPRTVQLILVELLMRGAPFFVRESLLTDMFNMTVGELNSIVDRSVSYSRPTPGGLFDSVVSWIASEIRLVTNPVNWIHRVLPDEESKPSFLGGFLVPIVTLVSPYGVASIRLYTVLVKDLWQSFLAVVRRGRIIRLPDVLWREMVTHLLLSYVLRKDTKTPYGLWSASSRYASILPSPPKIQSEHGEALDRGNLSTRFAARTLRTYARHLLRLPPPR
jgi:hypothetical protein